MRKLFITLLLLFAIQFSKAQFGKSSKNAEAFSDSLSIIVKDFKKNFISIEGQQLTSQGEMDVYRSKITVPGASHCAIYRFHSLEDPSASWQAIMYEGESYDTAVNIYKSTFQKLIKSKMKWEDNSILSFKGTLEIPDENIRFTMTSLKLTNIDLPYYKNFFGEIELTSTYNGWEVHLNLHNKKDDAEK